MNQNEKPVVLAIVAHPDDIEFTCAGTLALLKRRNWDIHCLNLANGSCGSSEKTPEEIADERWGEAQDAAKVIGATVHPPLFRDLEIFFNNVNSRRIGALLRQIRPNIVLTHAVKDYMEDHMETARLALNALFSAGIPNYFTEPPMAPYDKCRALYHCLPHGLKNPEDGRRAYPEFYINIDSTIDMKREALACHRSQKKWLDHSQGMNAYLDTMSDFAKTLGSESGNGTYAEGFTRHFSMGMATEDYQPLETTLSDLLRINSMYPSKPNS